MCGRETMDEVIEDFPKIARKITTLAHKLRDTHVADRKGRNLAVCFDPAGKCHYRQDNAYGDHIVAVLGEQVSDAYLAELRADGVSYLFAGPDGHDLHRALEILGETFQAKTLVLQGGAVINGAFLKAALIDEISLLIYPGLDGLSGESSIFGYKGTPDEQPAKGQTPYACRKTKKSAACYGFTTASKNPDPDARQTTCRHKPPIKNQAQPIA